MSAVFVATYIVLWLLVLTMGIALVVALRQLGILSLRLGPQGALATESGPEIGSTAQTFEEIDLHGKRLSSPWTDSQRSLLVFVSPTCAACPQVLPSIKAIKRAERKKTSVIVVSSQPGAKNDEYEQLSGCPVIASEALSAKFEISTTPYALAIDEQGIVRAKGIVNHIEHVEALLGRLDLSSDGLAEGRTADSKAPGVKPVPGPSVTPVGRPGANNPS